MLAHCHDTTDHGLTRLESSWGLALGAEHDIVHSVWRVGWPDWNTGLVVLPRLPFVVRLCPDEGTDTRDRKRANEVL